MPGKSLLESIKSCFESSNKKLSIRYVKKEDEYYHDINDNIIDWWKILFCDKIVSMTSQKKGHLDHSVLGDIKNNMLNDKTRRVSNEINRFLSDESMFLNNIGSEIKHLKDTIYLSVQVAKSKWDKAYNHLKVDELTKQNIDNYYREALLELGILFFDNTFELLVEDFKWFTNIIGTKENYCKDKFTNEQILTMYACALLLSLNIGKESKIDNNIKNYLSNAFPAKESISQMILEYKLELFEHFRHYVTRDFNHSAPVFTNTYVMPKFKSETEDFIDAKTTPVTGHAFRSIILGNSGLGKTQFFKTLVVLLSIDEVDNIPYISSEEMDALKEFALEKKQELELGSAIPVYFEANDFNNIDIEFSTFHGDKLCDIILENSAVLKNLENNSKEKTCIIDYIKNQKNTLVLIDGLDEINPSKRNDCCRAINEFAFNKKEWSFIVSSRRINIPTMHEFENWIISPFDTTQQASFIDKLIDTFFPLKKQTASQIKETISNNIYLSQLSSNPCFLADMLHIMMATLKNNDDLTNVTVKKIYKKIAELLIKTRMTADITRKYLGSDLSDRTEEIEKALSKVAFEIVSNSVTDTSEPLNYSLDSNTTKEIIKTSLKEEIRTIVDTNIDTFIDLLSYNSGLIVYNEDDYSFINNAFLWYYASEYLINNLERKTSAKLPCMFADTRGKYMELIWNTMGMIAENIDNEAKTQTLIMAFPSKIQAKKFKTSAHILLDFLLFKSVSTSSKIELDNIAYIFENLLNNGLLEEQIFNSKSNEKALMERIIFLAQNFKEK